MNQAPESTDRPSPRLHLALHVLASALLLSAGALLGGPFATTFQLAALRDPLLALGLMALLVALLRRRPLVRRLSVGVCVSLLTAFVVVAAVEAAGRLAGFDFRLQAFHLERTPPNWRKPRVPTGTVFFRRRGPLEWTGQVTKRYLETVNRVADSYAAEPVITVRYDRFGFRNEPRPEAWEIAVAGDSFTELGDIPYDRLFTTLLAQRLSVRVLNLGVGNTGPLAHLSYLADYGLSTATRQTVIVFFEGNDLWDLSEEAVAEQRYAQTGTRPHRDLQPQTSFLRALGERLGQPAWEADRRAPVVHAFFAGAEGAVPVTLGIPPPGAAGLPLALQEALADFLGRYAAFGRHHRLDVWLAYMPCKERVLAGRLHFTEAADDGLREWEPTDLPRAIADACQTAGVQFLDLTPALVGHTRTTGELLFNRLHDCHLNARGSEVVSEALARALLGTEALAASPPSP
ncbi:MAG: hypothetical protein FJ387_20325 [Verrucomicrobia bacterium]|nr:hypothetical protein [Verrucomicrobiota bacterium]